MDIDFDKIKRAVGLFFSRIWVAILKLSYPAQSNFSIKTLEEKIQKQSKQQLSTTRENYSSEPEQEQTAIQELSKERVPKGLAIGMLLFFAFTIFYYGFILPPKNFPTDKIVTINQKTLDEISQFLEEEKLIKSSTAFKWYIKLIGKEKQIKEGDYMFKKPVNMLALAKILYEGRYGLEPVKVYIPEGSSVYQIADILENKLLRFDREKFIRLAKPYEGKLFPDTYYFMPNAKEEKILQAMLKNFEQKIEKLKPYIERFGKPLDEVLIMASIVEKESWKHQDRRKIAGVLWRRLEIGMPLQVDATFVYTHNKGSSQITLQELKDKSNPYNTYANKGLPPTPIGNPGYYAILATVTPIFEGYLYYLADSEGNTYFSRTYQEHMKKREKYINW